MFGKGNARITRVTSPDSWFTIVFFVILVDVNDVVADEVVCGAVVLAVCRADGLVTTACVVCTRVHCDGVADRTMSAAVITVGPKVFS